MKKIKFLIIGVVLLIGGAVHAQFSVHVNFTPPPWEPVGYSTVRYYYLPDVEAYYDNQASMFIYFDGGRWVHRASLPGRYKNYDLYRGYKVVMNDYHGDAPYGHFREHKQKYGRGYRGEAQRTIRERPGGDNHHDQGGYRDNNRNDPRGHDRNDSHGNKSKEDHGHGHDDGKGKRK